MSIFQFQTNLQDAVTVLIMCKYGNIIHEHVDMCCVCIDQNKIQQDVRCMYTI